MYVTRDNIELRNKVLKVATLKCLEQRNPSCYNFWYCMYFKGQKSIWDETE